MIVDNHIVSAKRGTHLNPKEWVLLHIRNQENYINNNDNYLNIQEQRLLDSGFKPNNVEEQEEFESLMGEWQKVQLAEVDAKLAFFDADCIYQKTKDILMFSNLHGNDHQFIQKILEQRLPQCLNCDLIDVLLKNSWVDLDQLKYVFAFEIMDLGLKKDLWIANNLVLMDSSFLRDQKVFGKIMAENSDSIELAEVSKIKIVDAIISKIYFGYKDSIIFNDFGPIRLVDVAKMWAQYNNIDLLPTERDKKEIKSDGIINESKKREYILVKRIHEYSKQHKSNPEEQLRNTVSRWLNEGLLDEMPFFYGNMNRIKNRQKDETARKGRDLYAEWLKTEINAQEELQRLIDAGDLVVRDITHNVTGKEEKIKAVSAESIYRLRGNYRIVKDFREQVESMKNLGALINLWVGLGYNRSYEVIHKSIAVITESAKVLEADLSEVTKRLEVLVDDLDGNIIELDGPLYVGSLVYSYVEENYEPRTKSKFTLAINLVSLKDFKL